MIITTTDTKELTIDTKALSLEVNGTNVEIDIVGLMKLPVGSEDCWVNIAPLVELKSKGGRPNLFLRQQDVKAYIVEFYKCELKSHLDFTEKMISEKKVLPHYPMINGRPVVDVKSGRYGGTWIHRDLLTKFASWISVEFEVAMHKTFMDLLRNVNSVKVVRESTKDRFHGLVEVIDNIYAPNQSSYQEQSRHKLMDMINMIVLGMTSRKFRKINDVKDNEDIRDKMKQETLDAITKVEEDMKGFIEYGGLANYSELKEKLTIKHQSR
jgi:hypothetical protein